MGEMMPQEVYRIAVCSSLRHAIDEYERALTKAMGLQDFAKITKYRRKVEDLCAILDKLDEAPC